jgi:DNA-binding NarL/FixJ family response regulator
MVVRILLVDDQRLFVENLKIVLESSMADVTICGIASHGEEAVCMVADTHPDLVLMDVRMPIMDGVQATRMIRESHPHVKIIMLTTFSNDEYVLQALKYGAVGYILKDIPPKELFSSITAVLNGAVLVSPSVMAQIMSQSDEEVMPLSSDEDHTAAIKLLSDRDREIIELISMAHTNRQIGDILFMAEQTVKNQITQIYQKLGVTRRAELMNLVNEWGLRFNHYD